VGHGRWGVDGFDGQVDRWVRRETDAGDVSFGDLVRRLPGVDPGVVVDALRRGSTAGWIPPIRAEGLIAQSGGDTPPGISSLARDGLPVPHPLDFDWRFSGEAVDQICGEAALLSRHRGHVGVVGAPTVALELARSGGHERIVVFDINPGVVAALRRLGDAVLAVRSDVLTDKPPRARLDVVVTDPPWYFDELCSSLRFCRATCRSGGFVLASIPPLGTRPGIAEERARLLEFSGRIGLELVGIDPARLTYRSPPFEQNALRRAGLTGTPVDWRRGDLATFVRRVSLNPHQPKFGTPTRAGAGWSEVAFSAMRVRVRPKRAGGFTDPRLMSIVEGDVFPTVSRRDPRRELAGVWTSGNRVYGCTGSDILLAVAEGLSSGVAPRSRVERRLGRPLSPPEAEMTIEAAAQLTRLVGVERRELRAYAGGIPENRRRVFAP